MTEPDKEDLKTARDLVSLHHIEDRAVAVAHAIGDARTSARSAALENAELHELTDAACKVATKLGLEITIRVKEKRAKKGT